MRKVLVIAVPALAGCSKDPVIPGCERAAYYSVDVHAVSKYGLGTDATIYECLKWAPK